MAQKECLSCEGPIDPPDVHECMKCILPGSRPCRGSAKRVWLYSLQHNDSQNPLPLKCPDRRWLSSVPRRPWAVKKEAMAAWGQRFWWWTHAGSVLSLFLMSYAPQSVQHIVFLICREICLGSMRAWDRAWKCVSQAKCVRVGNSVMHLSYL